MHTKKKKSPKWRPRSWSWSLPRDRRPTRWSWSWPRDRRPMRWSWSWSRYRRPSDLAVGLATLDLVAGLATLDLVAGLATLDLVAGLATLDLVAGLATLDLDAGLATVDLLRWPRAPEEKQKKRNRPRGDRGEGPRHMRELVTECIQEETNKGKNYKTNIVLGPVVVSSFCYGYYFYKGR